MFGGSDGSGNCIAVDPPGVVAQIEGFLPFKNQRLDFGGHPGLV